MSILSKIKSVSFAGLLADVREQLEVAYPDDLQARFRGANLFYICIAIDVLIGLLLILFLFGGFGYLEAHAQLVFAGLFIFIIATFSACIRLVLKGQLQMARLIVVALSVGAVFMAITLTGGFPHSVASPAIMISVVMCYCLYGWRASLKTTFAMITACLVQWAFINIGWFNPPNFVSTTSYEFNFVAVILATTAVACSVLAIFDVSNQVLIKRANASNLSKTNFLANTSHEIRTPMNGIIGMTEVMMRTTNLDADQKMYMDAIHKSGTALMTIINDILDYSRLDAGRVEIQSNAFNLYTLLHEIRTLLTINAAEKNIVLHLNYGDDLPQRFKGDAARIRQVIINLMANAIKFTENGSVSLNIAVDQKSDGPNVKIEVIDTGIGIPESKLNSIFERFTQAESGATQKYGGTGLGLSISQKLVELMGGKIGVESKEGQGSTFWFTLDLKTAIPLESEVDANQLANRATENIHSLEGLGAARVLIVTADQAVVENYGSVLCGQGYRVFHSNLASQIKQWLGSLEEDTSFKHLVLIDQALEAEQQAKHLNLIRSFGNHVSTMSIGASRRSPQELVAALKNQKSVAATKA